MGVRFGYLYREHVCMDMELRQKLWDVVFMIYMYIM